MALLLRRGEVLRLEVNGVPAGITRKMLDAMTRKGKLKPVPIPGRKRAAYRQADVLKAFCLN